MRTDLWVLFTRPFWLDEWHTVFVARRESIRQVISDLHNGSDFGPPFTHLLAWVYGKAFGLTPVSLRLLSLTFVVAGLVLLYFALRRRFDTMPSVCGVLAVASHQLVLSQALEWRFYAAWIAFACAFAWALSIDDDKRASTRRDVAIALASVGMVTSHWFGIITLGLMSAAAFTVLCHPARSSSHPERSTSHPERSSSHPERNSSHPERSEGSARWFGSWKYALRRTLPAVAGVLAFAVCLPLMLGQRASVVEKSWMPDFSVDQLRAMLRFFWVTFVPAVGLLLALMALLLPTRREQVRHRWLPALRDPAVAGMLAVLVMPLVLAVVSLRQPAMLPRYAIVLLLAWAPIVAFGFNAMPRAVRILGLVWLVGLTYTRVLRVAIDHRNFLVAIAAGQQAAGQSCSRGIPILFQVRHLMYPSADGENHKGCDLRYVALSNETLAAMYPAGNMPRFFRLENEFSEMHGRMYGFPVVASEQQMDTTRSFLLVGWDASLPQGYKDIEKFRAAVFPQHRVTRVTENLALFEMK